MQNFKRERLITDSLSEKPKIGHQNNIKGDQIQWKDGEHNHQSQKIETLNALVAGIAHEINNPMNLILNNAPLLRRIWVDFLPILKDSAAEDPQKKFGGLPLAFLEQNLDSLIADVVLAANRVTKIVGDLKNFARQSRVTNKKAININEAVENALRLAQTTIKNAGTNIKLNLSPDMPMMEGNLQNIEQIILNLLINALQAINHEKGLIKIETGVRQKEGNVFVSVADNGKGIDPSISDRLFDPFVTNKKDEGGTGLGLTISYNLLKAHNGEIVFKSEKGEGTTFSICFPPIEQSDKTKILVVDDDPVIRKMLIKILATRRDYLVDEACNGVEACIKLGTFRPTLLVLDVFMPDMDGVEVCRAIANDPELDDVKVVITTGFSRNPKLEEIERLGYTKIITKPFNLKEFIELIGNTLAE